MRSQEPVDRQEGGSVDVHAVLVTAFSVLTDEELVTLAWHARRNTRICCGRDAELYTDGRGGG